MSVQDHLRTCSYCNKDLQKPTVRIKAASSYRREKKLAELAAVIKGVSYPGISYAGTKTKTNAKGASVVDKEKKITLRRYSILSEKQKKLKELGRLIRG